MSTDPQSAGQPSPEELQAYLDQLRDAPVAEIVLEAVNMLGTVAQAKLGRRDARVLIDSMDAIAKVAGPSLGEHASQLERALGQLKLAQVQAEKQLAAQGEGAEGGAGDQPDAGQPGAAQPGQAGQPGQQQGQQGNITDRLWIPGR